MIQVQRIGNHDLPVPAQQTDGAAGYDLQLRANPVPPEHAFYLSPGERIALPTGFAWKIPRGFVGMIRPRSGLASREGLDVLAGVADADFRGEVKVILINHGTGVVKLRYGDRIAQMVVQACLQVDIAEVDELDATERGNGGFGSTDMGAAQCE